MEITYNNNTESKNTSGYIKTLEFETRVPDLIQLENGNGQI
jgi:hypothetical protein